MAPDPVLLQNRYRLERELGRGGFAVTYEAEDLETGKRCAVKRLTLAEVDSWKAIDLFEREAKILAHLRHPLIPRYLDFFTEEAEGGTRFYLVQEFAGGKNLAQSVAAGRHFTEKEAIAIAWEMAGVLRYLHAFSPPIIHRDIKPSNIILGKNGTPYLIDFGAVRHRLAPDTALGSSTVVGTFGYMPLEQFEGRTRPASDIYALGATLLFLLSHREPGDMDKKGLHLDFRKYVKVSNGFARVLGKMLEPNWERRYADVEALRADLARLMRGKRPRGDARKPLALAVGLVLLLVLVMIWFAARNPTENLPELNPSEPAVAETETMPPPAVTVDRVTLRGRLIHGGVALAIREGAALLFTVTQRDRGETIRMPAQHDGETFRLADVPAGRVSLSLVYDADATNPPHFPGDFVHEGSEFQVKAGMAPLALDVVEILHLSQPQDNRRPLAFTGAAHCDWPAEYTGDVAFAWEDYGVGTRYRYRVITVDCAGQRTVGEVTAGETRETEVLLSLPLSRPVERYFFELTAYHGETAVGRLWVEDEGGSGWGYGFRVLPESDEPFVHGRLYHDGKPFVPPNSEKPYFWFRNEDKNIVEYPSVLYRRGYFKIFGLPHGRFGMSVIADLNPANPRSYPGDLRTFVNFQVSEHPTAELDVHLLKIIQLTSPQDNGGVMEQWGAECDDKIAFTSPVRFAWKSLGPNTTYDFQLVRMDCQNYYRTSGTVAGQSTDLTEITLDLPPSQPGEVYGLHIYARRDGRRIGMLMTHGAGGYGWDYRFRIHR